MVLVNDIFKYDTIADSSGNTKDTITDFKQSTLNATTGAQITNGDSISLIVQWSAVTKMVRLLVQALS